jgi:ABC-type ATPase with predicted acetyltransferase domain
MRRFLINRQFDASPPVTDRVLTVMRMFGVTIDRLREQRPTHKAVLEVEDGDIVYITGPSGAGKSVLLWELQNAIDANERISIDEIELPADKAAIDCVGTRDSCPVTRGASEESRATSDGSLTTIEVLRLLGYAGLSDVFCMLTAPAALSEGQKYRFRLACSLASAVRHAAQGKKYIFADEFCSSLDRITAAVIAYNVRKFAKRTGATFILASSHEDILADLQPDVLVVKHFTGPAELVYKKIPKSKSEIPNKLQ